jgi:hypothetical protein
MCYIAVPGNFFLLIVKEFWEYSSVLIEMGAENSRRQGRQLDLRRFWVYVI